MCSAKLLITTSTCINSAQRTYLFQTHTQMHTLMNTSYSFIYLIVFEYLLIHFYSYRTRTPPGRVWSSSLCRWTTATDKASNNHSGTVYANARANHPRGYNERHGSAGQYCAATLRDSQFIRKNGESNTTIIISLETHINI